MTTFQDGPAKGQRLMLRRAAKFIRVTEENGKWDALDQLDDRPRPGEKLYAYQIDGLPSWMHIRAAKGQGGIFATATYKFVPDQPSDEIMRDNTKWGAWCEARAKEQS